MTSKGRGRKLLIASIGVATLSYVSCGSESPSGGNLVAPTVDAGPADGPPTSGNLIAPPPIDAGPPDAPTVGNLIAPPPVDAARALDAT